MKDFDKWSLDFYHNFIDENGNKVSAILAQMRLVSINRFQRMLYTLNRAEFKKIIGKLVGFLEIQNRNPAQGGESRDLKEALYT